MTILNEYPLADQALIRDLRRMAENGAPLAELVDEITRRLGHSEYYVLPVLSYFTKTFEFPLRVVLPLREWIFDRDDREVEDLEAKITEWREARKLSSKNDGEQVS